MNDKLATITATPLAPQRDILDVIAEAVRDPNVDVSKMERLLAMKRDEDTIRARRAYMAALARLQAKLPQIGKAGEVLILGSKRKYARLEDIDTVIKPLLAEEGFSLDFDCASDDGQLYRFTGNLSHAEGHAEAKTLVMPIDHITNRDGKSVRSAAQDVGATTTYAKRQLIKMMLNIVEAGEDTDGAPVPRISATDVEAIRMDLRAKGGNEAKLCQVLGIAKLEDAVEANLATVRYFVANLKPRAT